MTGFIHEDDKFIVFLNKLHDSLSTKGVVILKDSLSPHDKDVTGTDGWLQRSPNNFKKIIEQTKFKDNYENIAILEVEECYPETYWVFTK